MPTGTKIVIDTTVTEPDTAFTHDGDDTIIAVTDGYWPDQIHIYTNAGDDDIQLGPTTWIDRIDVMHGGHIFTGSGSDTVALNGLDQVRAEQVIAGRLDDFDPASDILLIDGEQVDLTAPERLEGYDAEIILYRGQQFLRVVNEVGGQFIYNLEGARLQDDPAQDRDLEEVHFLTPKLDRDNIRAENWQVVDYENPINAVPEALYAPPPDDAPRIRGSLNEERMDDPEEAPAETIIGTHAGDVIDGKSGDDRIRGLGGDDTIEGGTQFDAIWGSNGNDVINAGKGHDTVNGGEGNDLIAGGTDRDRLMGAGGDDSIWGGTENDTLSGGTGRDMLAGGRGDDQMRGEGGDDSLSGDSGRDQLDGGAGNDVLTGGAGADHFIYREGDGADIITDFSAAEDRITLHLPDGSSPDLLGRAMQQGDDLVIAFADGGSLTIRHCTVDEVADHILFV